jgi:hypothetical protein
VQVADNQLLIPILRLKIDAFWAVLFPNSSLISQNVKNDYRTHPSHRHHGGSLCRALRMSPEEFLVARFADPQSGNVEPFLLSFTFKHYEQQSAWLNGSKNARRSQAQEKPSRSKSSRWKGFKVRATLIGDGSMEQTISLVVESGK